MRKQLDRLTQSETRSEEGIQMNPNQFPGEIDPHRRPSGNPETIGEMYPKPQPPADPPYGYLGEIAIRNS